jgi:uncharacterized protein (DUF427 family)
VNERRIPEDALRGLGRHTEVRQQPTARSIEEEPTVSATGTKTVEKRGRVRVEHGAKRVRAYLGGELVADTIRPLLVWEGPHWPVYYFPSEDVRLELLTADGGVAHSPSRGDGHTFTVTADGKEAPGAAMRYVESPFETLRDAVRFDWDAMNWFEEDEQIYAHARDPYHRIDILSSSREVRIELDGVTLAESTKPTLLFETTLPTRYYFPKPHVRMDLLTPTENVSRCPYKGQAEWWSVQVGDTLHADIAWSYPSPLPESQKIIGLVSFYNDRVDLYVDGVLQS